MAADFADQGGCVERHMPYMSVNKPMGYKIGQRLKEEMAL